MKNKINFIHTFLANGKMCVDFARDNHCAEDLTIHVLKNSDSPSNIRLHTVLSNNGWELNPSIDGGYFAWPPEK